KTTGEIDTPKTRRQLFVFMEKSGGLKAPEETWPDVTTRLMPDILARKQFSDATFVDSRGVKSCLITLGNPDATPYEMAVQLSGLKNANLINIGGTSASWFRYVAIHESTHCAPGNLVITHGPILDNMGITLAGEIRSDL